MKSPKQRFQEDKALVNAHLEKVDQVHWPRIVDAALLQMMHSYASPIDSGVATIQSYRLQGAMLFLSILENLPNVSKPVNMPNLDQLPHPNA